MCVENLKCVALSVPEIIAIGVFFGVVNPNLGEEDRGRRESQMVPFERALVTSYKTFIVTFPLS